jgi:phosphoribosylformylglycinamidine synthase
MKACVIVYPGSNCDRDCKVAIERSTSSANVQMVWHEDTTLPDDIDLVVIPGGFSYGDYLRCGAMAAQANIMKAIKTFGENGGPILGICNGFQILCEAGLLPGALLRNKDLKYVCKPIELQVSNTQTRFTAKYPKDTSIWMTQGNGDGNYYADYDTLKSIEDNNQVVFRYIQNPNGSANNIAGLMNKQGNILGMMPHPDRAFEKTLGSDDGARMFQSLSETVDSWSLV